ncbi:MAG: hypothetical protein QXV37_04315 [Candidatus Jordarchaeaceae archaeon]
MYFDWNSYSWFIFYKPIDTWNLANFGVFLGDLWRLVQFVFTILIRELDKLFAQLFIPFLAQTSLTFYDNILALAYYADLFTSKIWFYPFPLILFLNSFQMEYLIWPNLWTMVLSDLALTTLWSLYYSLFPLLLLFSIITGTAFILKIRMRYLVSSFVCMQTMLALAALTRMVNIGLPINTLFFSSSSFYIGILYGGVTGAVGAFLTSSLFFGALISYLYVEIGFQVIYMDEITSPALERKKMIEQQLKVVDELALASEEAVIEEVKENPETKTRRLSQEAIKFLRNIVEMKIFKKREKVQKEALHDIRRLKAYIDKVYTEIPEAQETLTAAAAAPSFNKVIRSAFTGTLLRVVSVIVFSFICFAALIVLNQVGIPLPVIESIESSQPEIVLVLLLPIALSFPMAAYIIGLVKEYGKKSLQKEKKLK